MAGSVRPFPIITDLKLSLGRGAGAELGMVLDFFLLEVWMTWAILGR